VSLLVRELHWLRVPHWLEFRLTVLAYLYLNSTVPQYLINVDISSRSRLRSVIGPSLSLP